jgi:hypothetical protein
MRKAGLRSVSVRRRATMSDTKGHCIEAEGYQGRHERGRPRE